MAGYRRSRAQQGGDTQTLAPMLRDVRVARARERMELRYAAATTPLERLTVVFDHIRALAHRAGRTDQVRTEQLLAELTQRLLTEASALEQIGGPQ